MAKRKCDNCGAPMPRDTHLCSYCGTDWTPDSPNFGVRPGGAFSEVSSEPIGPGAATKPRPSGPGLGEAKHIVIFLILSFVCCVPLALIYLWAGTPWNKRAKQIITAIYLLPFVSLGVFIYLDVYVYTVHADFEKVSATAPEPGARPIEELDAARVHEVMQGLSGTPVDERRKVWLANFAGRWVRWTGTVEDTEIYTSMPSEVRIISPRTTLFEVGGYFDPVHNERIEGLELGDTVTISGRLWGYEYTFDRVLLADAVLE
jgi:hypothetical protein